MTKKKSTKNIDSLSKEIDETRNFLTETQNLIKDVYKNMSYKECSVGIKFLIDESKEISMELKADINKTLSVEENHEKIYLKLLESVNNLIKLSYDEEENENEK